MNTLVATTPVHSSGELVGRPAIEIAIAYTRLRYGIYLPDANPEAAVEHSHTPSLLIAGTADDIVPMHHAQELENICASHCALWIVPGAGHGKASTVAHAEFEAAHPRLVPVTRRNK